MKTRILAILIILAFGIWAIPSATLAHHLSQGEGSAPDVVDNYAHGANAGGDVDSGEAMGGGEGPDETNMGGNDAVDPDTGEDSGGYGAPTDDGDNGPTDDIPGGADEPGGPADDTGVDRGVFDQLIR